MGETKRFKKIPALLAAAGLILPFSFMSSAIEGHADTGNPSTVNVGNVSLTTQIVSDGTGQGTSDACYLNSANGYSVGDNDAHDGIVCSYDTSIFATTISVAAAPTPTVFDVDYHINGGWSTATDIAKLCLSDPAGAYTGKIYRNASAGNDDSYCEYTVKPNLSVNFTRTLLVQAGIISPLNYSNDVKMNGEETKTSTSSVQVVSQANFDPRFSLSTAADADNYTIVQKNGVSYAEYGYPLQIFPTFFPKNFSSNKGSGGTYSNSNFVISFDNLPEGSLFYANGMTQQGNTLVGQPSLSVSSMTPNVFVDVPLTTAENTQWSLHVADVNLGDTQTTYPNYNGNPEPGLGQPSDFDTSQISYTQSSAGVGRAKNNDWVISEFHKKFQGLIDKEIFNTAGQNVTIGKAEDMVRTGTKLTDVITHKPSLNFPQGVGICDQFNNWEQNFDSSRNVDVYPGAKNLNKPYTITYGDSCDTKNPQAQPQNNTRAVIITFAQGLDLTDGDIKISIPMKINDANSFPTKPADSYVSDWAYFDYENSGNFSGNSSDNKMASVYVQDPYYKVLQDLTYQYNGNDITSVGASGSYQMKVQNYRSFDPNNPNDVFTKNDTVYTTRTTMSSCALNVVPEYYAGISVNVEPGDYGPDGVPCTSDDVHGPVVVTELKTKNDGKTVDRDKNFRINTIKFDVAPNALNGSTMTTTSTITAEYPDGTSQNYSTSKDIPVTSNSVVGQAKYADASRQKVGDTIGWKTLFFNTLTQDIHNARFVDVLPFNKDDRNNSLTQPLQNVSIDKTFIGNNTQVFVTKDDPHNISTNGGDPSNDPSNTSRWCLYGSNNCPIADNYTAILYYVPTFKSGDSLISHITAATSNEQSGDFAINNLGSGYSPDLSLSIAPTNNVRTDLYIPQAQIDGSITASQNSAQIGDKVSFSVAVKNSGTVAITPDVSSNNCDALTYQNGDANFNGVMDLNEVWNYSCQHTLTDADFSNGDFVFSTHLIGKTNDPAIPDVSKDISTRIQKISFITISGKIYLDNNVNYQFDAGEPSAIDSSKQTWDFPFLYLKKQDGTLITNTKPDKDGNYSFTIPVDTDMPVHVEMNSYDVGYRNLTYILTQAGTNKNTSGDYINTVSSQNLYGSTKDVNFGFYGKSGGQVILTSDKNQQFVHVGDVVQYTISLTTKNSDSYVPNVQNVGCDTTPTLQSGDLNNDGMIQNNETWVWTCQKTLTDNDLSSGEYTNTALISLNNSTNPAIPSETLQGMNTVTKEQIGLYMEKLVGNQPEHEAPGAVVNPFTPTTITIQIANQGVINFHNASLADDYIKDFSTFECYSYNYITGEAKTWNSGDDLPSQTIIECSGKIAGIKPNEQIHSTTTLTAETDRLDMVPSGKASISSDSYITGDNKDASFTKTVDKTQVSKVGEILQYTISFHLGDDMLQGGQYNAVLQDPGCDTEATLSGDTNGNGFMDADETWVWNCSHTVNQNDVNTGSYINTAQVTATANDPSHPVYQTSASAITQILQESKIQINACYNDKNCVNPASNVAVMVDNNSIPTNNNGSAIFSVAPRSNHDLTVVAPDGMEVQEVFVDGVSVGKTIPANVVAPDSGTRVITVVYTAKTTSVPPQNPSSKPVFESGV